ncbi:hypothetical protein QQ045_000111 [Rhodiola kirilowii]
MSVAHSAVLCAGASMSPSPMPAIGLGNCMESVCFTSLRGSGARDNPPRFTATNRNAMRLTFIQLACCRIRTPQSQRLRVSCDSQTVETQTRKCSPFLEKELLSGNGALPSDEWRAVPDIWRSSAEKYGDRVALVDPYHDPPTNLTYKQLEQEILNFCEGLRVVGVKTGEKIGLFADNSCRWLVADQGMLPSPDMHTNSPPLTFRLVRNLGDIVLVPAVPSDRFLSMLPPWHAYERACEYFIFTCGSEQVYTTVRNLKEDLQRYQPHYLITVPLVYQTLYSGIQKQISTSSSVRKLIAQTFIKISLAYKEFKRIYEGKYLTKDQKQPSYLIALLDLVWARACAWMLLPLHMLAKRLVYSKIHSAIQISKAGISGGGSLPLHVDKFFEFAEIKGVRANFRKLIEASCIVR